MTSLRARRLALAMAAVTAGLVGLGVPAGAQAPGATTTTAPTTTAPAQGVAGAPAQPDQSSTAPSITLVDQVTWLDEEAAWTADVRIGRAPAGATVQVTVHDDLRSRADLAAAVEGELGDVEFPGQPVPLEQLTADAAGLRRVGFGPEAGLRQGVHPVAIQVLDPSGEAVARVVTFLVVLPEDADGYVPRAVAVVLDLGAPTALQPDGEIVLSGESLARIEERIRVLEDAPRVPFTVAPSPETVQALANDTGSGPRLLERLDAATEDRTVLARPFTDIDVSALMAADLVGEVNAHADAGADVIREELGTEPVGGTWESSGTVGADAARQIADLGVGRALVDAEAVAEVPGLAEGTVPEVPVRLGEGGPEVMVADAGLAEPLLGTDPVLGAQLFVAQLAMAWFEEPAETEGVVVRVPADAEIDPALLTRALGELDEPIVVRPLTLPEMFVALPVAEGGSRPVATPAAHQPVADLRYLAAPLREARAGAGGIGGVLDEDTTGTRLEQSLLVATGATTPNDQRRAYVDRVNDQLNLVGQLVNAPSEFRITLTSRSGTIPVNITNDAGRVLRVRVSLQSDQLEFPDGDSFEQVLQPGANRVDVRVRVLASGAFPLDISITSPDGSLLLDETRFDIRSTAVSGVGLVLSIGAILFLGLWWVRNWRATTRSKRLVPADGDAGADDAGAPRDGPGSDNGGPGDGGMPPPDAAPDEGAPPARHMRREGRPAAPTTPAGPTGPATPAPVGPGGTGAPPWGPPSARSTPSPQGPRLTDPPPWARPTPPPAPAPGSTPVGPPAAPPAPAGPPTYAPAPPPAGAAHLPAPPPGAAPQPSTGPGPLGAPAAEPLSPFAPPGGSASPWAPPVAPGAGGAGAEGPGGPEADPHGPPPGHRPAHLRGDGPTR